LIFEQVILTTTAMPNHDLIHYRS